MLLIFSIIYLYKKIYYLCLYYYWYIILSIYCVYISYIYCQHIFKVFIEPIKKQLRSKNYNKAKKVLFLSIKFRWQISNGFWEKVRSIGNRTFLSTPISSITRGILVLHRWLISPRQVSIHDFHAYLYFSGTSVVVSRNELSFWYIINLSSLFHVSTFKSNSLAKHFDDSLLRV